MQDTLRLLSFLFVLCFFSCEKEEIPTITNPPPVTPPPITTEPPVVEKGDFRIGFYNVENLFDVEDDPKNEKDDEFLPSAPKEWTNDRYQKKLENIGTVLQKLEFPLLFGLAEVENEKVLSDLIDSDLLKTANYGQVHFDSPDFRGIDVALLYKKLDFTVLDAQAIEVKLPSTVSEFSTTRDILLVKGSIKGEVIYVFVNHWPSRSGGVAATSDKREFAASILKKAVDDILTEDSKANIIAIGDFNDEPYNESMEQVLLAKTQKPTEFDNQLYNCTLPLVQAGQGSYFFDSDWQMLDQAVVSGELLDDNGQIKVVGFNTFEDELVLFEHPSDGWRPNRTYSGNQYFGGFSDHLAVFLEVNFLE